MISALKKSGLYHEMFVLFAGGSCGQKSSSAALVRYVTEAESRGRDLVRAERSTHQHGYHLLQTITNRTVLVNCFKWLQEVLAPFPSLSIFSNSAYMATASRSFQLSLRS